MPILFGFLCLTLVVSAQAFNFSRDWFAVGRILETSLELRKETSYALALGRWLELEAERAGTLEQLWKDFVFVAGKLRLTSAKLTLAREVRCWESAPAGANKLTRLHEWHLEGKMLLELGGNGNAMSEQVFDHVSELAAESWFKAATRWRATRGLPLLFSESTVAGQSTSQV